VEAQPWWLLLVL
jgi:hypothetical protein